MPSRVPYLPLRRPELALVCAGLLVVDTPFAIGVDLAAVAAVQLAALWVVGWPVRALLVGRSPGRHHVAATPLIGLAVLQAAGWYAALRDGGITIALLAVCAGGALASVAIGIARARGGGGLDVRGALRSAPIVVVLAAVTTGLFAFHYQATYDDRPAVPVTGGNNDIAAYALSAEHLVAHGFDEPGAVVGTHVGTITRHDVFGAYALLVFGAAVTGLDMWQTLLPALLVGAYLCVLSMYCVVRRCSDLARAPAAAVALLSCASFLFVYVEIQYFLSQVIGMATTGLVFVLTLDASRARDRGEWGRGVGVGAALVVCTLFTYPHMVYLGVPVLVGLAGVAAATGRPRLPALVRAGGFGVVMVAIAFVVSPSRFVDALDRTIALSDIPAGWPLPFVTPSQLLGFHRSWTLTPSRTTVVASVALVVAAPAAAVALRLRSKLRTEPLLVLVVGLLASYAAAYARYGVSYNQWKWISYFQPLVVVGLAAPLALAVREVVRRLPRLCRGATAAATVLPVVLLVAATVNARHASRTAVTEVDPDVLALQDAPALRALDAVNVDLPPYWHTMWGMYAAVEAGVDAVHPHSLSYYPRSPHSAEWTLRALDDARPLLPTREAHAVGGGYHLVRYSTTPPAEGSYHVMGRCFGLYRYAGGRWVALARTPLSGQYRFIADIRMAPGRRDPVLVRGATGRVDVVGMRHVDGGRVAFFHEHVPGDVVEGPPVTVDPSKPISLDVVLDEVTGTVQVTLDERVVLDQERPLHRLGEWAPAEGVNEVGASVEQAFSGTLRGEPVTTEACRAAAARHGVPV